MKKPHALLVTIALAASAAFAAPVAAQRPPGGVVVRSGGVGVEDRAALEAQRARYNLRLAFAESDGGYVAEVHVRLTRPDGRTVYEGESDGPFLFAHLPPGRYRLEAEYGGITQVRTLDVGAAQAQPLVYLHWAAGVYGAGPTGGRG
jgi:hypothetical protein